MLSIVLNGVFTRGCYRFTIIQSIYQVQRLLLSNNYHSCLKKSYLFFHLILELFLLIIIHPHPYSNNETKITKNIYTIVTFLFYPIFLDHKRSKIHLFSHVFLSYIQVFPFIPFLVTHHFSPPFIQISNFTSTYLTSTHH